MNLMSETGLTDADYTEIKNIGYESEKMAPTFGIGFTHKTSHDKNNK